MYALSSRAAPSEHARPVRNVCLHARLVHPRRLTARQLSKCSLGSAALLAWAFAQLRWRPPPAWMDLVVTEACEREGELHAQELATLLHGCVCGVLGGRASRVRALLAARARVSARAAPPLPGPRPAVPSSPLFTPSHALLPRFSLPMCGPSLLCGRRLVTLGYTPSQPEATTLKYRMYTLVQTGARRGLGAAYIYVHMCVRACVLWLCTAPPPPPALPLPPHLPLVLTRISPHPCAHPARAHTPTTHCWRLAARSHAQAPSPPGSCACS